MDDATMIAAARRGSEDAFTWIYKKHLPYVKATGRAILRTNDLDDLAQETFLLAFTRLHSFEGKSSFRTWITRIAMNECLMILRKNRQVSNGESQVVELEAGMDSGELLEECIFASEDRNLRAAPARMDLPKLLQLLKPAQRSLLRMAYLDELPEREIAQRTGMSVPAVKSKIHHAKQRLREAHKKR